MLPHTPYFPDLTPSDFLLLPNPKKWLAGRRFPSNDEVKTETNAYFGKLHKSRYTVGIKKLETRWFKPFDLQGDNFEK